jgi:hypothetical protein
MPALIEVQRQSELWNKYDIRKTFSPDSVHKVADDILLRYPAYDKLEKQQCNNFQEAACTELDVTNYPAWAALPAVRRLVFDLMARVQGERLGKVLIARLDAGKTLPAHSDVIPVHSEEHKNKIPFAVYYDRYHIVLKSQAGVNFHSGIEQVYMATGEAWLFDNTLIHWVSNNSNDDRIHLIIDIHSEKGVWTPT